MTVDGSKVQHDTPSQRWTVMLLVEWSSRYLAERHFEEARLHVELLLAHVLRVNRIDLYLQFDRPLTAEELKAFKSLFQRRLTHEPLQYILGESEFMGLRFKVDRRVLIPRPETEVLVEQTVHILKSRPNSRPRVLDVGSGSGNIALAIAHLLPACEVHSFDVSAGALEVATQNQQLLGIGNVTFTRGDVFGDWPEHGAWDVIVSNPPYVARDEYGTLQAEIREFEPRNAVTDEEDGLRFLRKIAQRAERDLDADGALLVEMAYNQEARVNALMQESGRWDGEIVKDYAGQPRVLVARRRPGA